MRFFEYESREIVKRAGIPVTDHTIASRAEVGRSHVMPPPYVVKPVADGSSNGIFIIKAGQEHPPQEILGPDWKGGEVLMVERYIPGRELTCAVMGDVALGVTEIVTDLAFYNYEAKYSTGQRLSALSRSTFFAPPGTMTTRGLSPRGVGASGLSRPSGKCP